MFGLPMPSAPRVAPLEAEVTTPAADKFGIRCPAKTARRILYFGLVLASVIGGVYMMFAILSANGLTWLEGALLVLFSVTFAWIVVSFWSAAIGFSLQLLRRDPLSLRRADPNRYQQPERFAIRGKHAIVMPVYNEDSARVIAGLEASVLSLEATGRIQSFDVYLLSDSQDPSIVDAEWDHWQAFLQRNPHLKERLYYRRREKNVGRKVGNLMDFCQRWGSYYEGMIVLDADSIMSGSCVLNLVQSLEANPKTGLIQTVPIPVRQKTFFGRFLQFAADLYSPMLATGLAFWQTDCANYWGHNAIIRVHAFMDNCGLPQLPGKGAFGGEILSHDFVEAALLRRGGWHVYLLADLKGSFEEVPSNLLDYATRDRRWVQGNIQHLALLTGARLHGLSRLHFLFGAVAYLSTLVWLCMLGLSTVDAVWRAWTSNVFFSSGYQLFPDWPIAKTGLIFSMLYTTAVLLLLPKLMGFALALWQRRGEFGGAWKLCKGAAVETFFAILIAPLMMVFHSYFVVCVLLGRKVTWNAQARDGRMVRWREALAHTAVASIVAALWGVMTFFFSPVFFWWLMPVLVGLVFAAPLVRYSSSLTLGKVARRMGVFVSTSEARPAAVLQVMRQPPAVQPSRRQQMPARLLPRKWREMPIARMDS